MPKLTPNEVHRSTQPAPYGKGLREWPVSTEAHRFFNEARQARREAERDRQAVRSAQRRAKYTTE